MTQKKICQEVAFLEYYADIACEARGRLEKALESYHSSMAHSWLSMAHDAGIAQLKANMRAAQTRLESGLVVSTG